MLKKILTYIVAILSLISISLIGYTYYKYQKKIHDPLIKQISKNIKVELPEYYSYSVDNAYLASFILKTGVFALDKSLTLDGLYHKDWLPLAFNYCSLLKKDAFEVDNDFDNDGIPDFKDTFQYDYSNGDYSMRMSQVLDFDNDGIPNAQDKDADGNSVDDIFQGICMDRVSNSDEIKKIYPKTAQDLFITDRELIINALDSLINGFLITYKIDNPFKDQDQFNIFIASVFGKLLYDDSIVIQFGDKSFVIEKRDILTSVREDEYLNDY